MIHVGVYNWYIGGSSVHQRAATIYVGGYHKYNRDVQSIGGIA